MLANGNPVLSESDLSWLAFELGLAVLLYLAFKVALVSQLLARAKATRTRTGRVTLAMRTVTLTPLLVTGSVYDSLTSVVFWALSGSGSVSLN
jgi:hypothetical protein